MSISSEEGKAGENLAAAYLAENGYHIVTRNGVSSRFCRSEGAENRSACLSFGIGNRGQTSANSANGLSIPAASSYQPPAALRCDWPYPP